MSLIIAYKEGNVVYMGADTQTTGGDNISRIECEEAYKINKFKNGLLVGFTGDVYIHQKILASAQIFDFDEKTNFNKEYIVKNIIPKLYDIFDSNGFWDEDRKYRSVNLSILMVWKNRIFIVNSYLRVFEVGKCYAIGSGNDYALGAMKNVNGDAEEKIRAGLRIGDRFNNTVSAPYVYINSGDLQFKVEEAR